MTIVVEDGSGKSDANSYVSVADASDYAAARGLTFTTSPSGSAEAALIRGTAAIDAAYRSRFPGQRANGRTQALEWPRKYAGDAEGNPIGSDEIPQEVINATIEAAVREMASPNSMMPDLERGGAIKEIQAGSVDITYADGAPVATSFQLIEGILSGLLNRLNGGATVDLLRV
jgi:hypothetical protein